MADPRFFNAREALSIAGIERLTGAVLLDRSYPQAATGGRVQTDRTRPQFFGISGLELAGPKDLTFCDRPGLISLLHGSQASGCFVTDSVLAALPASLGMHLFKVRSPSLAAALVAAELYPDAGLNWPLTGTLPSGIHPSVRIGANAAVASGVTIGAHAEIGERSTIAAGAVIGPGVTIGRDCLFGPNVTIMCSHIGDRVTIHSGVRIGQDGFGYVPGPAGLAKAPQLGRVIIQDRVEIGANTAIDRGAYSDTLIGEGTKIDNLVQIAHNVRIGRHCVIAAQCGISGSSVLGDMITMGGQVGIADHVTIGDGAMIAARTGVVSDLPGGQTYGGFPARPVRQWRREVAALARLAKRKTKFED